MKVLVLFLLLAGCGDTKDIKPYKATVVSKQPSFNWNSKMSDYLGKTVTVTSQSSENYFRIKEDNGKWSWHRDWFIKKGERKKGSVVESNPKAIITIIAIPKEHVHWFWRQYNKWIESERDLADNYKFWSYVSKIIPEVDGEFGFWKVDGTNIMEPKLVKTEK